MTIVQYVDSSIRFFVYTANLIDSDWHNRTQGIWISPQCHRLSTESQSEKEGDSPTNFKADFLQYLKTYPVQAVGAWIDSVRRVDCSRIRVYFIASTPILASNPSNGFQWGTKKMHKILSSYPVEQDWPFIIQCSSIGSLGAQPEDWLLREFTCLMNGSSRSRPIEGPVYVVYPAHSNVIESFDGPEGGGCLPYSSKVHSKQLWLEKHLCQWKASCTGRSRAVPHIKTYCRTSPDHSKLAWFLLTSANLSKAAWGKLNKKEDKLQPMSWEAGVLFTPQMILGEDQFDVGGSKRFPLPIDIPVTKYRQSDKPWFMDMF